MTARWSRPQSGAALILTMVGALVFVLVGPQPAEASFRSSTSASLSAGTATLAPTGAVVADTSHCGLVFLTQPQALMHVTWGITASTFADGYQITPSLNGVTQAVVTVTGRNTLSIDYPVDRDVLLNLVTVPNTYRFKVRATAKNWTSITPMTSNAQDCPTLSL